MNKTLKKTLSVILAILMIATTIPFAFAAESDGVKTTLDVSKGYIVIADSYVTLGSETVEVDPDGYIITGTASGNTPLKFINDSGLSITFDLVFDNLSLTAAAWCSVIAIDDNSPVTLDIECKGLNAISSYNHSVFNNSYARTSITINITKTEGSSITFERQHAPEDGIVFNKDDTKTFVYINGNQLDAAGQCYVHKSIDGIQYCVGYLCDTCGQCFGEKDETNHYSDGVQTCCGYKCEFCDVWYGEAGDEHIDEDRNAFCDACDEFAGKEIEVGDTYTVTKEEYVKFVPTISGTYVLSSSAVSDPHVTLYDSDFEYITDADDNDGYNFSLMYEYMAGETYYFYFKDYIYEYNYSVIFECKEHNGGEANCTDKAACEVCGVAYGDIDADNHDIVVDEAVAPTCTETGLTEGSHCTRCDAMTVEQEVIPALNHKDTLVQVEAKANTCTEIGWDAYEYCTECEYTTYVEIPASHEIKTVDKKDATCTEAGHEAYEYCTECEYTTYKEIPSNGHTPLEAVKENEVAPKCGVAGSYDLVVYCDVCDEELDRDTVAVDALTHTDADGDYLCDNGCGHEFEKPAEPDTPDEPTDDTCNHICHSNNALVNFLWKIFSFFFRLFNIQQYCDCGVIHYDAPVFG